MSFSEFDLESWHKKKYGDKPPTMLSYNEFSKRLALIRREFNFIIKNGDKNIVGIILIGGYGRGEISLKSDLDFVCLTKKPFFQWYPADLMRQLEAIKLEIPLSYLGYSVFTDEIAFKENLSYFRDGHRIISPYKSITTTTQGILNSLLH